MTGKRLRLFAVVLLSNLVLFLGALLSQSQYVLAVLIAVDAVFGIVRILFERLAAGRPRGDVVPAMTPYRLLEPLYEKVLDKRGWFRVSEHLPPLYPRNLPFVIDQWVVFFWLIPIVVLTGVGFDPLERGLSLSMLPALCLFATKHYLIVDTWESLGVYEDATARTIRRSRDIFFTALLACVAVWMLSRATPTAAYVTATTLIILIPKFLFDCREAGIGPWPLAFDPSSDTVAQSLVTPDDEPHHVFENDGRVVRKWGIHDGISYTAILGIYLGGFLGLIGAWVYVSAMMMFLGVAVAVIVAPLIAIPTTLAVFWLGRANIEYRIHDDALVAYDAYLDSPQWVVPFADVRSISIEDNTLGWTVLGVCNSIHREKYPVKIECAESEDLRLRCLEDPERFVRVFQEVDQTHRERRTTSA